MPRFIVTRTLPPLTEDQLAAVGRKVVEACDQVQGMGWVRSHLTADGQHSFCEVEAPDAQAGREHARVTGLPVDDVVAIGDRTRHVQVIARRHRLGASSSTRRSPTSGRDSPSGACFTGPSRPAYDHPDGVVHWARRDRHHGLSRASVLE